jgi:hypothetical protein
MRCGAGWPDGFDGLRKNCARGLHVPRKPLLDPYFLKRGKSFAFSLIKKKRVAQLINGKPG